MMLGTTNIKLPSHFPHSQCRCKYSVIPKFTPNDNFTKQLNNFLQYYEQQCIFIATMRMLWWYRHKLPDTHTHTVIHICTQQSILLRQYAVSVASGVLPTCQSRVNLSPVISSNLHSQLLCQHL